MYFYHLLIASQLRFEPSMARRSREVFIGEYMKCIYKIFMSLLVALQLFPLSAEVFRFKYTQGNNYRILSQVDENVFFDGVFSHRAKIINRISAKVTEVIGNSGKHEATFMVSEDSSNNKNIKTWGNEYQSVFLRDEFGNYTIDNKYFMPVVRNIPIFPEHDVQIGESWTAAGHEAHDLRGTFNIKEPFIVPFSAIYTYKGTTEENGRILHIIDARYNIYFDSPQVKNKTSLQSDLPATTMGYSHQTIYWDNNVGAIAHYNEDFRIVMETIFGHTLDFQGIASAEVTDFETPARDKLLEVEKKIKDLGLKNTSVRSDEAGLTISIENIQFLPDSAILMDSEKEKLREIANILKSFPNDLLISGHTALAGTTEGRQILSEQRALSVADYLADLEVKDAHKIFTKGFGATNPIAPNNNEKNKARNRRVEITILDK